MSRRRKILVWSLSIIISSISGVVIFGFWFLSLIPQPELSKEELMKTLPTDLPYITENVISKRGKVLAVVTSTEVMGATGISTGYELTELARAYYVFKANGFEVDVASPRGGLAPVVIDEDDMKHFDYAFLNDTLAQKKVNQTIPIEEINPEAYDAVYFVGGKGAMWDFPDNRHIQALLQEMHGAGKVIGAVCHGPAALINVKLEDGTSLLANKSVSSFTNQEELLLISDAREIFPFLLQDKLLESGAKFNEGSMYLNTVSQEQNLVTGQNPWSTWTVAEAIVEQMGYRPKQRKITAEENSVLVLEVYEKEGFEQARNLINQYCEVLLNPLDRELLAVHSLLAIYQLDIGKSINLIRLLKYSNSYL